MSNPFPAPSKAPVPSSDCPGTLQMAHSETTVICNHNTLSREEKAENFVVPEEMMAATVDSPNDDRMIAESLTQEQPPAPLTKTYSEIEITNIIDGINALVQGLADCGSPDILADNLMGALRQHYETSSIKAHCLSIIRDLCKDSPLNRAAMMTAGISDDLVRTLMSHNEDPVILEHGCAITWSLGVDEAYRIRLIRAGACTSIIKALKNFVATESLVRNAIGALRALSHESEAREIFGGIGASEAVSEAMRVHRSSSVIQRDGCAFLSNCAVNIEKQIVTVLPSGDIPETLQMHLAYNHMTMNPNGSLLSREQKAELRRRYGFCVECEGNPIQLFWIKKSTWNPLWITKEPRSALGECADGVCFVCHPDSDCNGTGVQRTITDTTTHQRPVPNTKDFSEDEIIDGINALVQVLAEGGRAEFLAYILVGALRKHRKSTLIQSHCLSIIKDLCNDSQVNRFAMGTAGISEDLVRILLEHRECALIQSHCLSIVRDLCKNSSGNRSAMMRAGLSEDLFRTLKTHTQDPVILEHGCAIIWSLAVDDDYRNRLIQAGVCAPIVEAVKNFVAIESLMRNAIGALLTLSPETEAREIFRGIGASKAVSKAMRVHRSSSVIKRDGRAFLCNCAVSSTKLLASDPSASLQRRLAYNEVTAARDGSLLSREQKAELRRRYGFCIECKGDPIQLFWVKKSRLIPFWITKEPRSAFGECADGVCYVCHPTVCRPHRDPHGTILGREMKSYSPALLPTALPVDRKVYSEVEIVEGINAHVQGLADCESAKLACILVGALRRYRESALIQSHCLSIVQDLCHDSQENILAMETAGISEDLVHILRKHGGCALMLSHCLCAISVLCNKSQRSRKDMMTAGISEDLVRIQREHRGSALIQSHCLNIVRDLCRDNQSGMGTVCISEEIVQILRDHRESALIQLHALSIIRDLCQENQFNRLAMMNAGISEDLVRILREYRETALIQAHCLRIIRDLCKDSPLNRAAMMTAGISDDLVRTLNTLTQDPAMLEHGCAIIWSLGVDEAYRINLIRAGACSSIVKALKNFVAIKSLVRNAIGALRALSPESEAREIFGGIGASEAVSEAMRVHRSSFVIQLDGCAFLSNSAVDIEREIVAAVPFEELDTIVQALVHHRHEISVIQGACFALKNYVHEEHNCRTLRKCKDVEELMLDIVPVSEDALFVLERMEECRMKDESVEDEACSSLV